MSKHSISQSLWLRNRPISFLEGAAAVFDRRPLIDRYNVSLRFPARMISKDTIVSCPVLRTAFCGWPKSKRRIDNSSRAVHSKAIF